MRKQQTGRIDERTRRNDSGSHRQREWTEERERRTAGTKDRKTSNLFFSFQYVTSQYSSLSDRWVVRKGKKMERRLDLEREEEIRNHVKNENGLREMQTI